VHHQLRVTRPEEYFIREEPCCEPVGDGIAVFRAACRNRLPFLHEGPTGCGKTRFLECRARRLAPELAGRPPT